MTPADSLRNLSKRGRQQRKQPDTISSGHTFRAFMLTSWGRELTRDLLARWPPIYTRCIPLRGETNHETIFLGATPGRPARRIHGRGKALVAKRKDMQCKLS
jgi:hypothetical protein